MKLQRRLVCLERQVLRLGLVAPEPDTDGRPAEERWLAGLETLAQSGTFAHEPDFPAALALYRDVLQQAQASADPPFDPPNDFQPGLVDLPVLRQANWRDPCRFPELCAARDWLQGMLYRLEKGIPPVSEAEFAELSAWWAANDERLSHLSRPKGVLEVGGGRRPSPADLRYGLAKGPRALWSGELAEDLRQLRARYG